MSEAGARASHMLLDVLLAQDVAREVADKADPADRQKAGEEVVRLAYDSVDFAALFNFERQADDTIRYDATALLEAVIGPMMFLATELAACASITIDEVVAHARADIESRRGFDPDN